MANAGDDFYREVVRAGYRGAYLRKLASMVVDGEIDLERYAVVSQKELPDDAMAKELLALPGVGPYATAHIMLMLGRYSRPIFDSWTRPTYARLMGKETIEDAEIEKRFRALPPVRRSRLLALRHEGLDLRVGHRGARLIISWAYAGTWGRGRCPGC